MSTTITAKLLKDFKLTDYVNGQSLQETNDISCLTAIYDIQYNTDSHQIQKKNIKITYKKYQYIENANVKNIWCFLSNEIDDEWTMITGGQAVQHDSV